MSARARLSRVTDAVSTVGIGGIARRSFCAIARRRSSRAGALVARRRCARRRPRVRRPSGRRRPALPSRAVAPHHVQQRIEVDRLGDRGDGAERLRPLLRDLTAPDITATGTFATVGSPSCARRNSLPLRRGIVRSSSTRQGVCGRAMAHCAQQVKRLEAVFGRNRMEPSVQRATWPASPCVSRSSSTIRTLPEWIPWSAASDSS